MCISCRSFLKARSKMPDHSASTSRAHLVIMRPDNSTRSGPSPDQRTKATPLETTNHLTIAIACATFLGTACVVLIKIAYGATTRLRIIIAKQQATEQELHANEDSYRNQFIHSSSIMLLIDSESGSILEANEKAQEFYG